MSILGLCAKPAGAVSMALVLAFGTSTAVRCEDQQNSGSLSLPVGLSICMDGCMRGNGNVGVAIFDGAKGEAQWAKFGAGTLTIERFDAGGVVIRREDPPGTVFAGLTAVYQGQLHGSRIDGTVKLKFPGKPETSVPWFGTIPTTRCESTSTSAQSALDIAQEAMKFRQMPSAFQCLLTAASQGDGRAKGVVGLMYRDGIGTPTNFPEAFRWLKSGALQGDYNAEVGLAQMYELGVGTSPDPRLAALWKDKAMNNPVVLQQKQIAQQQQAAQQMMFMGLAAVLQAASRPRVYVVD